jgi:hypothetical protein
MQSNHISILLLFLYGVYLATNPIVILSGGLYPVLPWLMALPVFFYFHMIKNIIFSALFNRPISKVFGFPDLSKVDFLWILPVVYLFMYVDPILSTKGNPKRTKIEEMKKF